MSSMCGNCDCADKNQCAKGNQYSAEIIEIRKTFVGAEVMAAENCGNCKCGSGCNCANCSCCCN